MQYACDADNVSRAADLVARELAAMRDAPPTSGELLRAKALLIRQIPLGEASVEDIARGFVERRDLDLALDKPRLAAERYIALEGAEVRAAFEKWSAQATSCA